MAQFPDISHAGLRRQEGRRKGSNCIVQGHASEATHTPLILSCRPELSLMATFSCKEGWEMFPLFCVAMCPLTKWESYRLMIRESCNPQKEIRGNPHFHSSKKQPKAGTSNTLHVCDAKQMFLLKSDSDPFQSQHLNVVFLTPDILGLYTAYHKLFTEFWL